MTDPADCRELPAFPAPIHNRPGLPRIGRRIGGYASFRANLLAGLDQADALLAWTHRGADDPGIALLECTAIAGEILAFYQDLYVNEAYLRTAAWRESVARLVALGGYRLAPGIGGEARFALDVTGTGPVTVPAGFGIKAKLEDADEQALFETLAETTAWPWLGRFALYRPRLGPTTIAAGGNRLELIAAGGELGLAARQAAAPAAADRLLLVPDDGGRHEIVIVKSVETQLDRVRIEIEGRLARARGTAVTAYRIDRSFRHFGHNAPARVGALNETTGILNQTPTPFFRLLSADPTADYYGDPLLFSRITRSEMPLETEVDDLAVGATLIVTGELGLYQLAGGPVTLVREIAELRQDTLTWGGLSSGATVVTLNAPLAGGPEAGGGSGWGLGGSGSVSGYTMSTLGSGPIMQVVSGTALGYQWTGPPTDWGWSAIAMAALGTWGDIRRLVLHEALGPPLTLAAPSRWQSGAFGTDNRLDFFGTRAKARTLAGRALLLADAGGTLQPLTVTNTDADFELPGRDETNPWMWPLTLSQPPSFAREAFAEDDNQVGVYGNLVCADQGETQDPVAIGSGDARARFQTFKLPKAPLTWLLHNERTPPQVPELEVYVDGVRWRRVETLFGSAPEARVYVVREDEEGKSLVQFGDGKTGARLPSGHGNVSARYRVGSGAHGPLEPGQKAQPAGRLKRLKDVWMPESATFGAEREQADGARAAAPARLQSLGRLVGLADYEAEALALPGVQKAAAAWAAPGGLPRLRLVVMTDGGSASEAEAVAEAMSAANRCRGARRFPIETVQGSRRWLSLNLTAGFAADRLAEDIEPAIRAALGVQDSSAEPPEGLFGYRWRRFGQGAHLSQVINSVHQVEGVTWVRVDAFQPLAAADPPSTDPALLAVPAPVLRQDAVGCPAASLLALHGAHLALSLSQDSDAGECAA